jgi:PKD repeat protein
MKNCILSNRGTIYVLALLLLLNLIVPAVTAQILCTANFKGSPTSGCAPLTVKFSDSSPNATKWWWSFPGGSPSTATGKGPHNVIYATPGIYSVKLDIACGLGKDSEVKKGYIVVNKCICTTAFTGQPTTACVGQKVTFTDQSTNAIGWLWSFPGGTPSAAQTKGPHEVTYGKAGDYTVTLNVQCGSGSDSETKTGYIHIGDCVCMAEFDATPTTGELPLTVKFTDHSTNADSWAWTFPGGVPSSAQGQGPHNVTYYQEGYFDARLDIHYGSLSDSRVRDDYIHPYAAHYEFGDAPEGVLAYPSSGVMGKFPTCKEAGAAGYIQHDDNGKTYLGPDVDYEADGNGGLCPAFSPDQYNHDETAGDGDCGVDQAMYTITGSAGSETVVPLMTGYIDSLGSKCETGSWGTNLNLWYYTENPAGAYVNVLIDWNQDGEWGGTETCPHTGESAPERILRNFHVPEGNGFLSSWDPPDFQIGPNPGYVWARFTITEEEVPWTWTGDGEFDNGETEDHLLYVGSAPLGFDFGDAPACYRTLSTDNGAYHTIKPDVYLGKLIDDEPDGPPDPLALGDDNNGLDDEDGVFFDSDTLVIGDTIAVNVEASVGGYLKAWIDYNGDGDWDDAGETVFDNFQVGPGSNAFQIILPMDAKEGITYARFRYSEERIETYDGPSGSGEVEDYHLHCVLKFKSDYGDAPEGALAYPTTGVTGKFPTCESYDAPPDIFHGPAGFIRHGVRGRAPSRWFGDGADLEYDGNAGNCPSFAPDQYDQDETCSDGDAGIIGPVVYTIMGEPGSERLIPVGGSDDDGLNACDEMHWGDEIDMEYTVNTDAGAYINVLFDWNQDGRWSSGSTSCTGSPLDQAYEHTVKNLYVPRGNGKISDHVPSHFHSGRNDGYVWVRFSITEREVPLDEAADDDDADDFWDGAGVFSDGETEDYLLHFNGAYGRDFGDAPDSALAYPSSGQIGYFPTCTKGIPVGAHYIEHDPAGPFGVWFGWPDGHPTQEYNGNHDFCSCLSFTHFNKDFDDGLQWIKHYTLTGPEGGETVVEDPMSQILRDWDDRNRYLGHACQLVRWGDDIDLAVTNTTTDPVYINALFDWNQDGEWGGEETCGVSGESAPEHVLQNFEIIGARSAGSITAWGSDPPDFRIGPNSGYVWARFTITDAPVPLPWNGAGHFHDGETEDYLLRISMDNTMLLDLGDALAAYRTNRIDGGAVHRIAAGFWLGDTVDADEDGQCDPNAMGDDQAGADDEDGVTFKTSLEKGKQAILEVAASAPGVLNGWIDFNADSSWDDPGEHFIADRQTTPGPNSITFAVPGSAVPGKTYVRFRFSDAGGLSSWGPQINEQSAPPPVGEVEDYMVTIGPGTGIDGSGRNEAPREFRLSQNYPNPFNPSTELQYALPTAAHVRIVIYDLAGHELRVLVNEHKQAGEFVVQWDGKDQNGNALATGMYVCTLTAGNFSSNRKLLLMK